MDDAALELVRTMLARHAPALELYARGLCDCPEDVVQEALLRLGRERPAPTRPVAWLYCVVRRLALSSARAAQRRRRHETTAARPEVWFDTGGDDALDAQLASAALAQMDPVEREVVVARVWGGLSFAEIGELVGCSSSAAQRRYVAGLARLRERLGEPCLKPNTRTTS